MAEPFLKHYLMTAGPTPLPPAVSQVMAEPMLYHRAPAFVEVYARCLERLKRRVPDRRTRCSRSPPPARGRWSRRSPTSCAPASPRWSASCGKFGERWAELCEAYGADTTHHEVEWGTPGRARGARPRRSPSTAAVEVVFTTYSETSTGVVNDIQGAHRGRAPARRADRRRRGVGARRRPAAAGRVGRRRGGGGLAEGADVPARPRLRERQPRRARARRRRRRAGATTSTGSATVKGQRKDPPDSPFTPAVGLFMALDVALEMIETEGLDAVFERHRAARPRHARGRQGARPRAVRPRGRATPTWSPRSRCPDGVDGGKVPKLMRDKYGVTIAGGQGQLKGKIVRIAHCGYFGAFDILTTIGGARDDAARARRRARARAPAWRRRSASSSRRACRPPLPRERRLPVLVKEKIADSGVDLLRERFEVDLGVDWEDGELESRIGEYDAILIRSATQAHRRPDRAGPTA